MGKGIGKKQWTVLAYIAGDNDLESAGSVDLAEMKQVGSTDRLNIVAQFDRAGSRAQTRRYYLRKGTRLGRDIVASLGETNMGDPKVLSDFLSWGARNYPAEHYLVVIWNHGSGWDDTNIYASTRGVLRRTVDYKGEAVGRPVRGGGPAVPLANIRAMSKRRFRRALFSTTIRQAVQTRAIAFDDQAEDFLDNIELKRILNGARKAIGRKIDVLGMDACLMSMAEVAYQLRDAAEFMVGSQETEPTNGWPYNTILREIARRPDIAPEELARVIVDKYLASYRPNAGVTQSALRLAGAKPLGMAINALGKALERGVASPEIRRAVVEVRSDVQSYDTPDYVDLADLCKLLRERVDVPGIRAACDGVLAAAAATVVASGFRGKSMENSNGLSIYFPTKEESPLYARLDIARSSRWNEFLDAYLAARTRRPG
jgi:hypothetical protein